jgi:sphinganine-1-phosphate aldolase
MPASRFPGIGSSAQSVLDELRAAKRDDVDWRSGRTNMYVQFGGDDVLEIARQAADLYYSENAHGTAAFPSVARLQADVLSWLLSLVQGGSMSDGCFTASGSESILISLKAARDWARARRPDIGIPKIVVPQSAHPAFDKAGGILGLEVVRTPLRPDYRADVELMEARICSRTIMLVGSAPQFGHGVIDPIVEISALSIRRNLWMHVDACIGALFAPFARSLGVDVPPFDFAVDGVRSISADIHKYGFGAKGASVALFRHRCWRESYVFEFDDWPIGSYASSGLAGTRSAAPIAAAWAVMRYLGHDGYVRIAGEILETCRRLQKGLEAIEGVELVCRPDLPIIAWRRPGSSIDAVASAMTRRGWFIRTMARPSAIHMGMLTMHQAPVVDAYLDSVRDSVAELSSAA